MINAVSIVKEILDGLDCEVIFYHPQDKYKPPVVSIYEMTTNTGFAFDNAEQAQLSYIAVDVWGNSFNECTEIAIQADSLMQAEGWKREFSRDLPPEDNVYHKAMRYKKQIFFD